MAEDNKRGGGSSERGFASMDPEKQREIASKGGSESPGNFKNDPERAAELIVKMVHDGQAPLRLPLGKYVVKKMRDKAAALTREGSLVSVAGGGDTVAALNQAGAAGDFTFISTAGGAFLEWMEGKELPGVAALHG